MYKYYIFIINYTSLQIRKKSIHFHQTILLKFLCFDDFFVRRNDVNTQKYIFIVSI